MIGKLIIKSKRSISNVLIIVFGIIFISFFIFLLDNNFKPKNEYENNSKILVISVLSSVIIYCFYYILKLKQIYVYENYFLIKTIFKKKYFYYSEIITLYSEEFDGEYNSWTEYYIVLKNGEKITLLDSEYSNFHEFYFKIKAKSKIDENLNNTLTTPKFKKYATICLTISVIIFGFSSVFYDFKKIENSNFIFITSTLNSTIEIIIGKNEVNKLIFKLKNTGNYDYKITNRIYDAITNKKDFLQKYNSGKSIKIGIDKSEYEKKILKIRKLNLFDKFTNFSEIEVYQIVDNQNNNLVNLDRVYESKRNVNFLGITFFTIFGLIFLYLAIGNYKAFKNILNKETNKKTTHNSGLLQVGLSGKL